MEVPSHPHSIARGNEYFENDDGSTKIARLYINDEQVRATRESIAEYKWDEQDFLLATYPKNGTHLLWEIMTMLLRGSPDYIKDSKITCMIDLFPVSQSAEIFPSPRVLNTHYRLDVLPKEFRGKKTVLAIRNPKDTAVSQFYHDKLVIGRLSEGASELETFSFSSYLKMFLFNKDVPYSSYFDYIEYMWSLRDDPNILVVYFEDFKMNPIAAIEQVNNFMGTQRSAELIKEIAEATQFSKMKEAKTKTVMSEELKEKCHGEEPPFVPLAPYFYRKGEIGDWKNHLTVAENEMFDEFLEKWQPSKEIPFKYSK